MYDQTLLSIAAAQSTRPLCTMLLGDRYSTVKVQNDQYWEFEAHEMDLRRMTILVWYLYT